tara:strand:+ start:956 stop:1207 length:252 start_codon:yes stop_codon:yes gene_type:complete
MIDPESIAKFNAMSLMEINDPKKAAKYLFTSVQDSLSGNSVEEQRVVQRYVLSIMEIVGSFDMDYADKIALEYLNLLKSYMHP